MDTEKLDDDVLETTEVIEDKEETVSAEEYVTDEIEVENSTLSPYSPLYNPRLDRSKEGKKNKVIFAGIIGVLILAVIGLIITMSIVVKNAMSEVRFISQGREGLLPSFWAEHAHRCSLRA